MKKSLRVAIVAACPFPYPRGTPVRIYRMAQILSELGMDVHVITYHLGDEVEKRNFSIHRIPELRFYQKVSPGPNYVKLLIVDPLLTVKLLRLHLRYSFDIIHAHHYEGLLASWPLCFFSKTPVIFDSHTLLSTELHHYDLSLRKSTKKRIGSLLDRYLPRMADFVICVSEQIRAEMTGRAGIPSEKISVIPNGLEYDHFISQKESGEPLRQNKIILGYAGNLAEYQGADTLFYVLDLLKETDPQICLHIYSNDSLKPYQPLIDQLGVGDQIQVFPSSFQSLPAQLSQTDILLNPRVDGAGVPLKLNNYMAAGKPIVTFAGSSHIITHGETGWIVPKDTAQSLADGIRHLLVNENLARKLGQNAQKFIMENASWQSRGEEIIQIYDKLNQQPRSL